MLALICVTKLGGPNMDQSRRLIRAGRLKVDAHDVEILFMWNLFFHFSQEIREINRFSADDSWDAKSLASALALAGKTFSKGVYTQFLKNLPILPWQVHTHDLKRASRAGSVTFQRHNSAASMGGTGRNGRPEAGDCASQNARKVN